MPLLKTMTAPGSGAVAIVQLHGPGALDLLRRLSGQEHWPAARLRLVDFAGLDLGLAVALHDDWVQLMPHGGPRVVQRLCDWLQQAGATLGEPTPRQVYPEAESELEALALQAIAQSASPAAVDRLLQQPALWEAAWARGPIDHQQVARDTAILERLRTPPTVVVVGRPNVGKSTLSNHLLGRSASVVADLPGTTRDWVGGLTELVPRGGDPARDAVAVWWLDTPGLRHSDDAIEQRAIDAAREVIAAADVLAVMRDPQTDWPPLTQLPRRPDVWLLNKADTLAHAATGDGRSREQPLAICAAAGTGVDRLQQRVLEVLGLNPPPTGLWAFTGSLCPSTQKPTD